MPGYGVRLLSTLQGTEPGAPGHVAAVVATLSERSLRAMARAAAEAAVGREGARPGSLTGSVSSSSLSPRTSEPASAPSGLLSAAAAAGSSSSVMPASAAAAASAPPVNLRRVSFSDTIDSIAVPAAAAASTGPVARVLEREKSLSLDDLVEKPPASALEVEHSWPPTAEEVAAGLAAQASSPRQQQQRQQQQEHQQEHQQVSLERAAKPLVPALRKSSAEAMPTVDLSPRQRPSRSGSPGSRSPSAPGSRSPDASAAAAAASRQPSRTLAFGSYEIELESLGLPPGTTLDDLSGSPREEKSNGAIGAELQALRDQMSQLQVRHRKALLCLCASCHAFRQQTG